MIVHKDVEKLELYAPRYKSKKTENICSNKKLYMNVPSRTTHQSRKVETPQISTNWYLDKQNVVLSLQWNIIQLQKGMKYSLIPLQG